ncbi:hypothetical protein [Streptomyces ipomoeae]|uniref:hypothetical protein n=1 Tax=Streptomyces ipomoeae TaxID=103232 RepID=UPI0015F06402|nr:hypothetical protein [Streptomyces ipomoeae]MDX2936123.1 hypothetical protein [Streptomyces ipomoeae]
MRSAGDLWLAARYESQGHRRADDGRHRTHGERVGETADLAAFEPCGRDPSRAEPLIASLQHGDGATAVSAEAVALWSASLDSFLSHGRLVVNCAGPSYRVLDTVARAVLRHGLDYVDAAGDAPLHPRLTTQGGGADA